MDLGLVAQKSTKTSKAQMNLLYAGLALHNLHS